MSKDGRVSQTRALSPEDWPTEPERRYARLQQEFADEFDLDIESRAVETDDAGRVHYLVTGDPNGEPVLLLHNFSYTGATWFTMAPTLADDYRLYAPDRPGRGLSAAPSYGGRDVRSFLSTYLVELLDDLDLDRAHVVGNSLGGLQGFLLEIDHDRVDRLCLLGGPGGVVRDAPLVYRLLSIRGLNRLLFWIQGRSDPVENVRDHTREFFVVDDSEVPETLYEVAGVGGSLPGRQENLRSLVTRLGSFGRPVPLLDISDEIAGIERPSAFIWGAEDVFFPPERGRDLAERMADAEHHELADHGHVPWLEPGDQAEAKVKAFLDR